MSARARPGAPKGHARALRLGTRRSALARAQADAVATLLRRTLGRPVELVEVLTAGDRSAAAVSELGGTGVFVTALREALFAGELELAVHSLKDLPTAPAPALACAIPLREDPRDVLVSPSGRGLTDLGPGARIGTGAPRRTAQLHLLGLGLDVVPIRGNVETRIKKAIDGEVDAVVLARAGLVRLDRLDAVTEILDPLQMLPAPGQAALAVECRADDPALAAALRDAIDDPPSRAAVTAERACLAALEAGCTAPLGALADVADDELYLRAVVAAPDGSGAVRLSVTGSRNHPEALGRRLADDLLAAGAATLMGHR